ncbi:MAG: kynureninase, partial [Bacilli bacterium]
GLAGWFSSKKDYQFTMSHTAQYAEGAGSLQIGTPNILSMAPLKGSLQLFAEAGIDRLRLKSLQLTTYLMELVESELTGYGFLITNPRENHRRGGHVSLVHDEAIRICKALRQQGVIPDYRNPNIIRLAPVALYTSFVDCYEAINRLKQIMDQKLYEIHETERGLVP